MVFMPRGNTFPIQSPQSHDAVREYIGLGRKVTHGGRPFTLSLHCYPLILPRFSGCRPILGSYRIPRHSRVGRDPVDSVFLLIFCVLFGLTLALVAGCAALERKK